MPKLIRPPGQTREVIAVTKAIGSHARTEILRMLSIDGPMTTSEVAHRLGVDHSRGAHRHLVGLKADGFITAEKIDGRGTIRWAVVPSAITDALKDWLDYVTGATRSPE